MFPTYHQLKAIHNTTKYSPYLREIKMPGEMNICAFRLILVKDDPVDFIFKKALLVVEDYTKDG